MNYFDTNDYLIMSFWTIFFFIFLGLSSFKRKQIVVKKELLSVNKNIAILTKTIFIVGTLFYFISFFGVGELKLSYLGNAKNIFLPIGLFFIVIGMVFMLISRWQLRDLSNEEMFFSINNSYLVTNGLYRYMKHPMYVGLIMIFLGSLVIYQNLISLVLFFVILYLIRQKIILEEKFNSVGD